MSRSDDKVFVLKLIFESPAQFQEFYVDEEESERFREALLRDEPATEKNRFHYLSTLDGKDVLIRIGKIKISNFLWEPRVQMEERLEKAEGDMTVLIGISGSSAPFYSDCETGDELYHIFFVAELGETESEPFVHYTDGDGEEVIINLEQVTFLQAPTLLIEEGREAYESEVGAEQANLPDGYKGK